MFLTYANNRDKETKCCYSYLPKSLTNLCMYIFLGCIIEPPASTSSPSILMVANRPPIVFVSYKSIFKVPFNNSVRKCEADAPPMPPPIMAKNQTKLSLNFWQILSNALGRKINILPIRGVCTLREIPPWSINTPNISNTTHRFMVCTRCLIKHKCLINENDSHILSLFL